jgi:GT2 family glycosyltransferase
VTRTVANDRTGSGQTGSQTETNPRAALLALGDFFVLSLTTSVLTDAKGIGFALADRPFSGPMVFFRAGSANGEHLYFMLGRGKLASQTVSLTAHDGTTLFTGQPGRMLYSAEAPLSGLWPVLNSMPAPARTARRIMETLCSYLGGGRDPAIVDLCRELAQRCVVANLTVQAVMPVGEKASLCLFSSGHAAEAFEGGSAFLANRFQNIGQRPYLLAGQSGELRSALLLLDIPANQLQHADITLWQDQQAVRLTCPGPAIPPAPAFGRLLAMAPGRQTELLAYLGQALAYYQQVVSPELLASLRGCAAVQAKPSTPYLKLGPKQSALMLSFVMRTSDGMALLIGACNDPQQQITGLEWLAPNGRNIPVWNKRLALPNRIPVAKDESNLLPEAHGFAISFKLPRTVLPLQGEKFLVQLSDGNSAVMHVPCPVDTWHAARDLLLAAPMPDKLDHPRIAALAPMLARVHGHYLSQKRTLPELVHGAPPAKPRCSIVIPLYKNLSFLHALLSALALDPDIAGDEIILVVDDPETDSSAMGSAQNAAMLYGLPTRVIRHDRNYGYGPAIMTGAAASRGRYILLLNSDVVPAAKGWLGGMIGKLKPKRGIAAVAPKLLFANGSIQHAGLDFFTDHRGYVYNRALYKGYPATFPAANKAGVIKAVTGACLLIERQAFEAVGGISTDYIVGDFEDTDLCLSLGKAGYQIHYEPKIALYHFERQSIDSHVIHRDSVAELYNQWLHQTRWFAKEGAARTTSGKQEPQGKQEP